MSGWQLDQHLSPAAQEAFSGLDQVFALQGEPIAQDPLSDVIRVAVGDERFYVKRYHAAGKGLRRILGRPRVKGEWQNLRFFKKLGIPVAPVVAWGLERRSGLFGRGAMITREVPNTLDLATMARQADPRLSDPQWVARVSRQVAEATRTMHARRFTHNDLKWRNLLVNDRDELFLIDCPTGTFWWGPFLRHRIVKDLACLDKLAKRQLSRTQRLRFYLHYRERSRLIADDKPFIHQVLSFFEGRE